MARHVTSTPDPILAAIEAHKLAREAEAKLVRRYKRLVLEIPRDISEATAAVERTTNDVLTTRPTTLAGTVELLRYLDEIAAFDDGGDARLAACKRASRAFHGHLADAIEVIGRAA